MVKKASRSKDKEDAGSRPTRRSARLQAKLVVEQLEIETGDGNQEERDGPEELTFSRGGEQAREERQRVIDAVVRTSKELRTKRRTFAERNKIQKERKREKAMQRLPDEVLKAVAKRAEEKTEETASLEEQDSADEEDVSNQTDDSRVKIDHGPFDVVTVRQVVNKPRGVNKTALDFRHEHLYGDRLKRVDSLTFRSQKLKRHGPAVIFSQRRH